MVRVGVGQYHRVQVAQSMPERVERSQEQLPVPWRAGIDERQAARLFDQVEVGNSACEPTYPWGNFGWGGLWCVRHVTFLLGCWWRSAVTRLRSFFSGSAERPQPVGCQVDAEGVPVVLVQRGDHGDCACVKDDCSGPVGVEQPRRQFGAGHVTGLAGQRIAEFSLQFLQPTAVAGDADHVRAGFGQGDGRGPPEATAGAGEDHRGAGQIYSCHFAAPCWLAGSAALELLIRAGAGIHRSVSRAKWGLSIRWQQARGWARYGPASRAKASWPPSRAASSRPCSPVIASAPTRPPPRRPGWTRHFASPTAPPVVRAAPPRRAGGRARSPRRSARPRRTAATADAASGTR